ncbi:vitamin K epoxide reductase family protein [Snuella sedimenti]|uniref:Thioredoxin domain-containing protein n=1 Tax=Snuella sedimenti TaxID=2798802 RepID=A0A8J7J2U4_9FLAO|nr:vitamin K epoxide reductase family protein [Snuella sedimenti]MBJ6367253.1 thioredoxin domain-containing protein [Snuella sedimenti]
MDNCINATGKILTLLKVRYTKTYLKDNILSHPDHPSLLTISDTFDKYTIENAAIEVDKEKLDSLPIPCIVQVTINRSSLFYVLNSIKDNSVTYYNENNKLEEKTKEDFLRIWTGICLLVERNQYSKEENIEQKVTVKRILTAFKSAFVLLLLSWMLISFYNSESVTNPLYGLYLILKLIGLVVGIMLLWFDIDQYSPVLQSFCGGSPNSKINCNAVLNSKQAKLFNETLSLSILGFAYFFATSGYALMNGMSYASYGVLGTFSLVTIPVIFLSIYHQAVVIKQWCKFCMYLVLILIVEISLSVLGGFYKINIEFNKLPLLGVLFLLPILLWNYLKPLLELGKEANLHKRGLKKIKNNPNVLNGLLVKSRKMKTLPQNMGITLTSENAKYDIVKVCNPYCGPCAKAHPVLEELVKKQRINLKILFKTSVTNISGEGDPVSHLLAIDSIGDKKLTQQALNDWYLTERKNYNAFAKKYPVNVSLNDQYNEIRAMEEWCKTENITYTPTIFVNGYELPKDYNIEDLKDVL